MRPQPPTRSKLTTPLPIPEQRKRYSFAEWIVNFLEADAERYAEAGDADEWDTAAGGMVGADGDFYDDADALTDGVAETLIIVGLAAALALLVYFRQRQQLDAGRRAQQGEGEGGGGGVGVGEQVQQQRPALDRGMFPAPDDPEFANWAVGGVGH